jgi:hypothetical protein
MEAEELVFHNSSEGQEVKEFGETFPDIGITIFAATLIIKAIDLCNLSGLMVASKKGDSIFEPHLQSQKKGYSLHAVVSWICFEVPLST